MLMALMVRPHDHNSHVPHLLHDFPVLSLVHLYVSRASCNKCARNHSMYIAP